MRVRYGPALFVLVVAAGWFLTASQSQGPSIRFEITSTIPRTSGRLIIVAARTNRIEPRRTIGETGEEASPIFGRDVENFGPGSTVAIENGAASFPIENLDLLPPGDYFVQAVLHSNRDIDLVDAPGNGYSNVERVHLDAHAGGIVRLAITNVIPAEQLPPDDEYVKYVRIQSGRLTRFHGRPIFLRAGVIVPRDYTPALERRSPVRVHIGGYGTRFTAVRQLMRPGSEFRRMWLADDTPRFLYIQLDGAGPFGDPYQVNSDNNGPYGDAITAELIPFIEAKFHAVAQPYARVLDGESTGGWVSLALKIFYPDFFNAVWAACPDGVDFRGFQLINIYDDTNAYFDDRGGERPSKRDLTGRVEFTIRHECRMENVLGRTDTWAMSGQQWGAWNAVYGPRGTDGRPIPLWDAKTGVIDHSLVEHWKRYDLRLLLQQNWTALEPKVRGKLHISVGEYDNYYLNNAVHMLDDFFKQAYPPADAQIKFGPAGGHCWSNLSELEKLREMATVVEQR